MRLAILCLVLLSCNEPHESWCDNGKHAQCVKPIASHGDCTVYRLYDRLSITYRDFMRCKGSTVAEQAVKK
jgi:hypothetical protein